MKKALILMLFIATTSVSFSQQTSSATALTKQDYLKKSKTQKAIGWSLLGAGAITWLAGLNKYMDQNDGVEGGGETAMVLGTAMSIGGVVFVILGAKNKKKALSLSLNQQKLPYLQKSGIAHQKIPALSVQLSL